MEQLLIITGSMGAGKTAVMAEASDILALRRMAHAAVDLDSLGLVHLPSATHSEEAMYQNFRSVCKNYGALGVPRLLLARALENRAQLDLCREIVSAKITVVCRLTSSVEAMQHRVRIRESGLLQQQFVARVAELNAILDLARLEDFTVSNENRSLRDASFG